MINKRIGFTKTGILKFIGHLDLLRTFQRAFRRAEVPLAYSQGFNPHPLLSFANPLALGMTSEDEYADITLETEMDDQELVQRMNAVLPPGLSLTRCVSLPERYETAMALVTASTYRITFPSFDFNWSDAVNTYLSQDQIMVRRLGKVRGRKQWLDVDVKSLIYQYEMTDDCTLVLTCACGSTLNLKVDSLLECFYAFIGHPEWLHEETIHRTHLYQTVEGQFAPLM
ncbi:MAG: TIGR03936 family radical SAM-associated protein [Clostridiales bacterium]|nr:TIGR03936 family radical SAM-associated protein [Clostridiales bacterium]